EIQTSLSFQFRIAQNTISRIIPAECMAISQVLQNEFMKVPDCPEEWRKVANDFLGLWNFPMCLGALDAKAKQIVLATCCLHNFLRSKYKDLYTPISSLDHEEIESRSFEQGTWRNDTCTFLPFVKRFYRGTTVAKEIRNRFTNYSNGPGSVSWQRDMCDLH
ncbi:hypothetical protein AVEN_10294-1, partial [Araneus ventricosus]